MLSRMVQFAPYAMEMIWMEGLPMSRAHPRLIMANHVMEAARHSTRLTGSIKALSVTHGTQTHSGADCRSTVLTALTAIRRRLWMTLAASAPSVTSVHQVQDHRVDGHMAYQIIHSSQGHRNRMCALTVT